MLENNFTDDIKLTPMLSQWLEAKKQYQDAILLFRMGDFYELFGDDAIIAAPILDIALTSRDKNKSGLKMAGFPFHAAQVYIAKLIEEGHKVAICEQLEDPKNKKGLVKRGVKELITPATFIDLDDNISKDFSFLCGLYYKNGCYALATLELASSNLLVTSSSSLELIISEINRISPKEIVLPKNKDCSQELNLAVGNIAKIELINLSGLLNNFNKENLNESEFGSIAILEEYFLFLHSKMPDYIFPKKYSIEELLLIDNSTRINLNILPNKKGDKSNLLSFLTHTKTQMGRKFLHKSLLFPSTSLSEIKLRQDIVEEFLTTSFNNLVRDLLSKCYDIEKIIALAHTAKINPRHMANLRDSLDIIAEIKQEINSHSCPNILSLTEKLDDFTDLRKKLQESLLLEPSINLKDGNCFRLDYDPILQELYSLSNGNKEKLLEIEEREKLTTGINSLKVRYTRVFGYYIEVTKTHLNKVPKHYIRKQTIATGERFVTEELNELEILLNTASERIYEREAILFEELRDLILHNAASIIDSCKHIGMLDCLSNFAYLANEKNWIKPKVLKKEDCLLKIIEARHPIIEHLANASGNYFVPNNIDLSSDNCLLALITGPNMAGKSTIMRQVAIIQIMAQIGCFVPAKEATLSICDAIFARVGASDDLALGRSTFMVEMKETAQILNQATKYSLILLDEIGRGTSTYDGLSIAKAVAEYLHNVVESRTLFATHYHELTQLSSYLPYLKNFYVEVLESSNDIKFLYVLKEGFFGKSFGIQVARLAGIPDEVLNRAKEVLAELENDNSKELSCIQEVPDIFKLKPQLTLFTMPNEISKNSLEIVYEKIKKLDINRLTPLQGLNKLSELQKICRRD